MHQIIHCIRLCMFAQLLHVIHNYACSLTQYFVEKSKGTELLNYCYYRNYYAIMTILYDVTVCSNITVTVSVKYYNIVHSLQLRACFSISPYSKFNNIRIIKKQTPSRDEFMQCLIEDVNTCGNETQ